MDVPFWFYGCVHMRVCVKMLFLACQNIYIYIFFRELVVILSMTYIKKNIVVRCVGVGRESQS